jgi:hypothetical protein
MCSRGLNKETLDAMGLTGKYPSLHCNVVGYHVSNLFVGLNHANLLRPPDDLAGGL